MTREFVSYEIALALKELGFNEPCMAIYYSKDKSFSWHHHKDHTNDEPALDSGEFNISAPTYSAAFRWFREKHGMHHTIQYDGKEYIAYTHNYHKTTKYKFDTYEEAELACLDKLIEIIKNEQSK